jgi:GNAT superfamily N-acetyltransferase
LESAAGRQKTEGSLSPSGIDPGGQWEVRRAQPEDVGAVAGITDAAYRKYIPLLGRAPQPMTADHARMIADDLVWLLLRDGDPVGVLELVREPECLLIYSVAIRPGFQGQGLGRCLLDWAERQAARAGSGSLRLYTNALMTSNITLYRGLGYKETAREPYLGSTLVHVAKRIGLKGDPR